MKHVYTYFLSSALVLALLAGCSTKQEMGSKAPELSFPPEAVEPIPTEDTEAPPIALGSFEDGVYTNAYAGFGCDFGDDWEVSTSEDLQEFPDNIQDILDGTEYSDAASAYAQIADMNATNISSSASILVLYTKLDTDALLRYLLFSEETLVDDLIAQRNLSVSSYTQLGIKAESIEKVTVDFLGEKRFAIHITSVLNGVPYFSTQIPLYKIDRYSVSVTFGSAYEDITESLTGLFYKVD